MATAYEMPVKSLTIVPAVDLTAQRYTFVHLNTDGKGVVATAKGESVGVLQEPNGVDQPANTMFAGISFVYFDGAVASGQEVEVGTGGKAKAHVPGTDTGIVKGICMVGGADGDIGCILLK